MLHVLRVSTVAAEKPGSVTQARAVGSRHSRILDVTDARARASELARGFEMLLQEMHLSRSHVEDPLPG